VPQYLIADGSACSAYRALTRLTTDDTNFGGGSADKVRRGDPAGLSEFLADFTQQVMSVSGLENQANSYNRDWGFGQPVSLSV
jgi:hypothetical protein